MFVLLYARDIFVFELLTRAFRRSAFRLFKRELRATFHEDMIIPVIRGWKEMSLEGGGR